MATDGIMNAPLVVLLGVLPEEMAVLLVHCSCWQPQEQTKRRQNWAGRERNGADLLRLAPATELVQVQGGPLQSGKPVAG